MANHANDAGDEPDRPSGFFGIADADPMRTAVVEPDRTTSTTYGQMAARANRLAHGLRDRGLQPGDTVAIMSANSAEMLQIYAAGVQTGLFMVVLNWHLTPAEIAYILENSGSSVVFAEDRFAGAAFAAAESAGLPEGARFVIGGDTGAGHTLRSLIEGRPDTPPEDRAAGQAVFYTSGTTGKPKGVRKKFRGGPAPGISLGSGIGMRSTLGDPGRVEIVAGPLYHAAPLATAVTALDAGAGLVLLDHFDAARFLAMVEEHQVTNAMMVPTMFHRLLALPDEVRRAADVSSLRGVIHMGAPCPVEVKRRMIEWFGPIITEAYSSTEGAGTVITSEEWLQRPGSVGRPSPGVTVAILDDDGNPCGSGQPGLVYLTPAMWEFEYLDDAVKTKATRRNGMFTVGDIGYLDDEGYLFLCDRQAEVIISGGVNIYPAETEAALLEHPLVADVAVVGVPSEEWGEEVRAVVELAPAAAANDTLAAELVEHCRARIAHYKCPKAVDFVDSIGRDPNGKLRKATIRDRYWSGRSRRI